MKYETITTTLMKRAATPLIVMSIITSMFILPGCSTAEEAPMPRRIPFKHLGECRIDQAIYTGTPVLTVVTDQGDCVWRASLARQLIEDTETIDFEHNIVLSVGCCFGSSDSSFHVQAVKQIGTEVTVEIETFGLYPGMAQPCVLNPVSEYHLLLIERALFQPNGELHFTLLLNTTIEEEFRELAETTAVVEERGPTYTREIQVEKLLSTRRAASKDCLVITNQNQYKWAITDWAKEAIAEIVPEIDFDRYILLAVSDEVPDSCYVLSIFDPAIQDGTRIQVMVEIEMESDFGIATVIPTTTFVLAEKDSFRPRGELQFVFYRNGEQIGEEKASI